MNSFNSDGQPFHQYQQKNNLLTPHIHESA